MKKIRYISLALMVALAGGARGQDSPGALPLPYTCDFSSAEKLAEEWTVVNNNDDYMTWEFVDWNPGPDGNPGCAYCSTNSVTGNDDYLISSPLAMKAGANHVKFAAKGVREDGPETLEIYIGTSTDVGSMTMLKAYTLRTAEWQQKAFNFNVDADGTYYIAIRSTSKDGFSTYLDDVTIGAGETELTPALAVSGILTPYSQCDYSAETVVGAQIRNTGTGDAAGITLAYTVNGGATVTETFDTAIPSDSAVALYFKTPADMEAEGSYTIKVTAQCGESRAEGEKRVSHKAVLEQLPLECDFSQGTGQDWEPYTAGSWTFDQFGGCYSNSTVGIENALFSRCITVSTPVRLKLAYSGGMFADTCSMKILLGPAGTDPSTWRTVYEDDKVVRDGAEKEFSIYDVEPGLYTFAIVNCSGDNDIPLNVYHISISGIYDYDIRAVEARTALAAYTPAEQFILETTGLADPMNVMYSLLALNDLVERGLLITVVDAYDLTNSEEALSAANPEGSVRLKQIMNADVILCSKADAVEEAPLERLMQALHKLNPDALVMPAFHGQAPFAVLDKFYWHKLDENETPLTSRQTPRSAQGVEPASAGLFGRTHHKWQNLVREPDAQNFDTFHLAFNREVSLAELRELIQTAGSGLRRAKGIVDLKGEGLSIVQYASGILGHEPADEDVIKAWKRSGGTTGEQTPPGFLVFIGRQLRKPEASDQVQQEASEVS